VNSPVHKLSELPKVLPNWPPWFIWLVCLAIVTGAFLYDGMLPLGDSSNFPYAAALLFSSFAGKRSITIAVSLLSIVLIVVGHHISPPGNVMSDFYKRSEAILVLTILAAIVIHRTWAMQQSDRATRELNEAITRLKILHGLLPICSACKQVKTEEGQWKQLEAYISDNSEAEFTHGMCNDCGQKMYGDLWTNSEDIDEESLYSKSGDSTKEKP